MPKTIRVLNIIGYLAMIAVNAAAVLLPINGMSTGEVSDKYPTLFTPAGYTFSIWAVIYFGLLLFTVYQATNAAVRSVKQIGVLFIVTAILNICWLLAWNHEKIGLSLVVMTTLLITLAALYIKTNKDRYGTSIFFVRIPFSIYFAWICAAMTANFAVFLKFTEWNMFGISEGFWVLPVLALLLAATSFMVLARKDFMFSLVIIWALGGILYRHIGELDRAYPIIIGAVIVMIVVIIIENIYILYKAISG